MSTRIAESVPYPDVAGWRGRLADWPPPGPIDLAVHDLPHDSSTLEWWYVNTHLSARDGRRFSLFASFFRVEIEAAAPGRARRHGHHLIWAIVDVEKQRYLFDTLLDPETARDGISRVDKSRSDERIRRGLREVLAKGSVPLPDRMLAEPAIVALDRLALDYGGNRFTKLDDGIYQLELSDERQGIGCSLRFTPEKEAVRHGDDGVVCTGSDDEMFYYFISRCRVEGTLRVDAEDLAIAHGQGWYDHEFGLSGSDDEVGPSARGIAWNWLSAQLDDGSEVSAFDVVDVNRGEPLERRVIVVDGDGARREHIDFTLEPIATWTSTQTFNAYPTRWRFAIPGEAIELVLECEFPRQEYPTLLAWPSFWEGRVRLSGERAGQAIGGLGFIERTGFSCAETLEDFFASVGGETRRSIDAVLPAAPTNEQARALVAGETTRHWFDGVDVEQLARTVIAPVRHVVDRAGKAWRSYGLLACVDSLGGDSEEFRHWLALPELIHVGSLIVDDVEDRSDVRRGGPACHRIYGEALAINAGTACYFVALLPMLANKLPAPKLARVYEAYFETMRAAHAGQALDIEGMAHLVPAVVESGDGAMLERRILAAHRLKAAVPPATLARMAAHLVDASEERAQALSALFEAYGLAFQIIDDVLNLRGFKDNLKTKGEDITHGKATAPIAKAMSRLDLAGRRKLWDIVSARTSDRERIAEAVALVDGCSALDACEQEARDMVETAWRAVDPLLPDSQVKLRLRAFGWFVLDRHY